MSINNILEYTEKSMIEVKNLSKKYGSIVAVDNISFLIGKGEVVGFLGLNGAGKSTTMNMLTGYIAPSAGEVVIDGQSMIEEPKKAKKLIGYLPEIPPVYMDMTVREYLSYIYELKKVVLPKAAHLQEVMRETGVDAVKDRLIGNLSKGYRQRVGIAYALIGNPPIIILDEPTAGLDPKQIIAIRKLITTLGKNHTIMLSTHILQEVQAVCKRIIVLNRGKIVADGNMDTLTTVFSKNRGQIVQVLGNQKMIQTLLESIHDVNKVKFQGEKEKGIYEFLITTEKDVDIRKNIFSVLAANNLPLMACRSAEYTMEELFIKLTEPNEVLKKTEEVI